MKNLNSPMEVDNDEQENADAVVEEVVAPNSPPPPLPVEEVAAENINQNRKLFKIIKMI